MTTFRFCLAAALLAAGTAHAETNLVPNGSFETGSFSAWQTSLGDPTTFVDYGPTGRALGDATDGHFLAFFGSTEASGGAFISQSVATTPGARYVLSFDLANDNAGAPSHNAFSVSLDGMALYAVTDLGTQDYAHRTLSFAAGAALSTLRFGGFNDVGYVELDAVNLAVAAVPEPASAVLLAAGLGVVGSSWASRTRLIDRTVQRPSGARAKSPESPVNSGRLS